jgi:hypothetical protein
MVHNLLCILSYHLFEAAVWLSDASVAIKYAIFPFTYSFDKGKEIELFSVVVADVCVTDIGGKIKTIDTETRIAAIPVRFGLSME